MAVEVAGGRYVVPNNSKSKLVAGGLNMEGRMSGGHLITSCSFGGMAPSRVVSRMAFCRVEILAFSAKQNNFTSGRLGSADSFGSLS